MNGMNVCELCHRAFATCWSASRHLCAVCLAAYRRREEQQRRQRDWMQAQFEQRAALRTVTFKVRVGTYTDFPGSVSGAHRVVPGNALAETQLILLDLYSELSPREWLALGDLGERLEYGDAGNEDGGSELA